MEGKIASKQIALIKLKDAIEEIATRGESCILPFAPDIIRDAGISESEGKNLAIELSGLEKDRLTGFQIFVRGGGHALLGANAAMSLRGTESGINILMLAMVRPKDFHDLVEDYLIANPQERGIAPADISFVLQDGENPKSQAANVVMARKGYTTIVLGDQPKLRFSDYSLQKRQELTGLLESAPVVANLSLKSPFLSDMLDLMAKGELRINELFCDCSSGNEVETNYMMLDILKMKGKSGNPLITLLSINEFEATMFEMLLRRENERGEIIESGKQKAVLIRQLDELMQTARDERAKNGITEQIRALENSILMGKKENAFEAAAALAEKTGISLLVHTGEGACIIGKGGCSGFVPSVIIDFPKGSSFVGAGDTLCGAYAFALAVKKKSDNFLPEEKKLTYEDCLLIANLATCYRLAKINCPAAGSKAEWYEAVGGIDDLFSWANSIQFRGSIEKALPPGISFVDVEKNSIPFGSLCCLNEKQLLSNIKDSARQGKLTFARAAFEELCQRKTRESNAALSELVLDYGEAGNLYGTKSAKMLIGRGQIGLAMLRHVAGCADEKIALKMASVLVKMDNESSAQVFFDLLSNFRLLDSFESFASNDPFKRRTDRKHFKFLLNLVKVASEAPISKIELLDFDEAHLYYAQNWLGKIRDKNLIGFKAIKMQKSSFQPEMTQFIDSLIFTYYRTPNDCTHEAFWQAIHEKGYAKDEVDRYLISIMAEIRWGPFFSDREREMINNTALFTKMSNLLAPPFKVDLKNFLMDYVAENWGTLFYDHYLRGKNPLYISINLLGKYFRDAPEVKEFCGVILAKSATWVLQCTDRELCGKYGNSITDWRYPEISKETFGILRETISAHWPELFKNKVQAINAAPVKTDIQTAGNLQQPPKVIRH